MFKLGHRTIFLDVLEPEGGHHTFHLRVSGHMFKLRWDTAQDSSIPNLGGRLVGGWFS